MIGIPDEQAGEIPKAFVVVKDGNTLNESTIHSHVNDHLSAYKRLRGGVQFVGMLPTSPSGKVLKKSLRK